MFRTTELGCGSFGGFLSHGGTPSHHPFQFRIFHETNQPASYWGILHPHLWKAHFINGHFRNLNWRYLPYIRPIFQAYVREYPHNSYGQTYGTNVPPSVGSWRSPSDFTSSFNNRGSDDGRVGQGPHFQRCYGLMKEMKFDILGGHKTRSILDGYPLKQWMFPSKMLIFHSFLYVDELFQGIILPGFSWGL